MFRLCGTRVLYLINAYFQHAAIEGARRAGARVVELQHGFISRFHLGYSWPGQPEVPYVPDELWCFGRFWFEETPLAAGIQPRVIGAPYLRELARQVDGGRDERMVVFASQGVIGRRLFDAAVTTAMALPELRIVFRLHPSEIEEDYQTLAERVGAPANFEISHRVPNVFALLAQAAIQVGVFSTTLLEGMALGTRTVVLALPGNEYMRPVIARGDALFVRSAEELIEKLDQAPRCRDPEYYYARPVERLLKATS